MRQKGIGVILFSAMFLLNACASANLSFAPGATGTTSPRLVVLVATSTPTEPRTTAPSVTPVPTLTSVPSPTPTAFITPPAADQSANIPILMYHHLNSLARDAGLGFRTWTVAPDQFSAQLDYLRERGFHTITLAQLVAFFDRGEPLPTNPIVLTFDDGWIEQYTVAFSELKKRGMVGVFFVPTRYVQAGGELLYNWEQALEMDRSGMEIGGHTIDHEDLTKTNLVEARRQLVASKAILEEKLGHPVVSLSYPFGVFNSKILAETEAAGYRAAVTLCCGYKQSRDIMLMLPRIRISYDDSIVDFGKRLPGSE